MSSPQRHACLHAESLQPCPTTTLWMLARQAPLSMGFPREEYCSGLPFPSPGFSLTQGSNPTSTALADWFYITEPPEKSPEGRGHSDFLPALSQCLIHKNQMPSKSLVNWTHPNNRPKRWDIIWIFSRWGEKRSESRDSCPLAKP